MVMSTSTPCVHLPVDVADSQPRSVSFFTRSGTTSNTFSVCPCFNKLRAMGLPMWPRPMNPIFIYSSPFERSDRKCVTGDR